jgi:hypothetical protein
MIKSLKAENWNIFPDPQNCFEAGNQKATFQVGDVSFEQNHSDNKSFCH